MRCRRCCSCADVPLKQVLRGQGTAPRAATLAAYGLGLGLFGALMVWQAGDLQVGLLTLAAFGAALLLFMLAARAALACLRLLPLRPWRAACGAWRWPTCAAILRPPPPRSWRWPSA
ncbi:hypothetical protein LP420_18130 [Massilia sp. B-10]|nr:hypothetical protein LP420_18130 [Massilia sp. B-10]